MGSCARGRGGDTARCSGGACACSGGGGRGRDHPAWTCSSSPHSGRLPRVPAGDGPRPRCAHRDEGAGGGGRGASGFRDPGMARRRRPHGLAGGPTRSGGWARQDARVSPRLRRSAWSIPGDPVRAALHENGAPRSWLDREGAADYVGSAKMGNDLPPAFPVPCGRLQAGRPPGGRWPPHVLVLLNT
jgi:hypothetical protein